MPEIVIQTNASRADVLKALRSLPSQIVSGTLGESLLTRCGLVLLKRIRDAFIVKSQGGTDEAGDCWAPLAPRTLAYRRKKYEAKQLLPKKATKTAQERQNERWQELYNRVLTTFGGNTSSAARFAWMILKKEGNLPSFKKYASSGNIAILRDTGALLKSLSPGSASKESVFRISRNELKMGTNRPGAAAHHYGVPRRNLPQRRLWPDPKKWPMSWWDEVKQQAVEAIIAIIIDTIKNL